MITNKGRTKYRIHCSLHHHLIHTLVFKMENGPEETPLEEVIYKPTVQKRPSEVLKFETDPKSTSFSLYVSAACASMMVLMAGIAFGWTSPVLPKLKESEDLEGNPLGHAVTHNEISWITGFLSLGAMLGPLGAGPIADKIGRKKTFLLIAFPMGVSLVITAFANSILLYYIMRFVLGVCAGSVYTVLPMYLGEIAEDHNRGTIGCFMGVFIGFGFLYAFAIGPYLSVRNFSLVCIIPAILFLLLSFWMPETPHFLASINDQTGLEASLKKLRKKSKQQIKDEASAIRKTVQEEAEKKGGFKDLFRARGLRKGLTISVGIIVLQQLSGINAVLCYMEPIFEASGGGLAPEISAIIIGVVQVIAGIVSSAVVDRLGRRILFLTSLIGCCISLVALGLYFYLQSNKYNVDAIFWLPVVSLLVYTVTFSIGMGPLPWAVMAELFPPNVKSAASTLTSFACFAGSFVITLVFPIMAEFLGMAQSFWVFAVFCVAGSAFVYWILPETKGKSLQEIQKLLEGYDK